MSHYTVAVFTDEHTDIESLLAPYDENIAVAPYVAITKDEALKKISDKLAEDDELREKFKNLSDKEKITEWYGYESFDKDGNPLTTYNKNAKWDWYDIGGRWGYMLKTKSGDFVDSCRVRDLDLTPDKAAYDEALRFWELAIEHQPLRDGEEEPFNMFREEYYIERYGTKENYAEECSKFSTYAVLRPSGEWYEPGRMGWFGMSDAEIEDEKAWSGIFEELLNTADPDWTITIVDCHI